MALEKLALSLYYPVLYVFTSPLLTTVFLSKFFLLHANFALHWPKYLSNL
jgi:hypothetical protein